LLALQMGEQGWIASLSVASSDEANGIVPIDKMLPYLAKVHSCRPAIIFDFIRSKLLCANGSSKSLQFPPAP
jgi:hypothetical protein